MSIKGNHKIKYFKWFYNCRKVEDFTEFQLKLNRF